nr:site-specific integrase [Tepidanaerobacter sp. EBM-49]
MNQSYVICWDNGEPFQPDYISQTFKSIIRKLKLPDITFHDLRHTHATLLLEQGVHPKIVQERLGHSTISMTLDTYSHVLPNIHQEAANKMDDIFDKNIESVSKNVSKNTKTANKVKDAE